MKKAKFFDIALEKRAIFLPHCLCSTGCPAKRSEEGVMCINCGKCNIGPFKKTAEKNGYKVFIVPGASMVKKIIGKYKFKAVFGVACMPELEQGIEEARKKGIIALTVPLLKDGCVNTDVDWDKVRKTIRL